MINRRSGDKQALLTCKIKGMVKNLVEKADLDKPIVLYNRTTARAEALASSLPVGKVKVAKTFLECVAEADIIMTCVGDDNAVKEISGDCIQK